MINFLKKLCVFYKKDKDSRACESVNGINFMNEINTVTKGDHSFIRDAIAASAKVADKEDFYDENGFYK